MDILEDFKLHEETLEAWIRSCNREEQIPICENAVNVFIIEKFKGQVEEPELATTVHCLRLLIGEKEREIKYYSEKPQPNANASPSY